MAKVHILGIAGSLRAGSYHRMLLKAAQGLLPAETSLEIAELLGIPVYNTDEETPQPAAVVELKRKVRAADAILFAAPEYNYSIAGPLKNAIDWVSRPYGDNSWDGKPVGMVSASVGMLGGFRAQNDLRRVFVFVNMHAVGRPEVLVSFAPSKFNEKGELTDEPTRKILKEHLEVLAAWTRRLRGGT
jgi:chromate reductase